MFPLRTPCEKRAGGVVWVSGVTAVFPVLAVTFCPGFLNSPG